METKTELLIGRLKNGGEAYEYSHNLRVVPEIYALEAADRLSELQKVIDDAEKDLRSFMTTFVREHFPHVPQWQPLPNLLGMLSQMDNASTIARDYVSRLSEQQQVIDELHSALWGVRENLIRLAWDANTVMIEGIDKALSRSKDYK